MKKIAIIGGGLVGSCFNDIDGYEVIRSAEWKAMDKDLRSLEKYRGFVNCCAIGGQAACEAEGYESVIEANVVFAYEIACLAEKLECPFVTFSSTSVYARPPNNKPVDELSPVYPHNLYAASKILMESVMPQDVYIFRIPSVITGSGSQRDFSQKVKSWKVAEDVVASFIYKETIIQAVGEVMDCPDKPGTYNLHSDIKHLPTFIKEEYGWTGDIVPSGSLGLSPFVIVDATKAIYGGLIKS